MVPSQLSTSDISRSPTPSLVLAELSKALNSFLALCAAQGHDGESQIVTTRYRTAAEARKADGMYSTTSSSSSSSSSTVALHVSDEAIILWDHSGYSHRPVPL